MYDRILVPTDGSVGTAHVALQAIDLAQQYGAELHVLNVIELSGLERSVASPSQELRERAEQAVERVQTMAEVHDVAVTTEIREGDPAGEILDYAEEIDADLIVSGTHGRSGVRRRLIGSVAERLVRHADRPVMTVRLPETDVTVEDDAEAREIVAERLAERGGDASITGVERQVNVWVAEATVDGESLVVYLDPVSQRTSVVERD